MKQEAVNTALGAGTAIYNKGKLYLLQLASARVAETDYQISVLNLYLLDGADQPECAEALIAQSVQDFTPWLQQLEGYHLKAMALLEAAGWPADIALSRGWFQFNVVPRIEGLRLELMYYAAGPHLRFWVNDASDITPKFTDAQLDEAVQNARRQARKDHAPPLKHKVFGTFKPDDLITLKRRKLAGRFVDFDLYLPDDAIEGFEARALDGFVPLHRDLATLEPVLREALAGLRADWVENWLDPENANVAGPFHAAFPEARASGQVDAEAFTAKLRLSQVCLMPFGSGLDARGAPMASWDFHLLDEGADNTIFVARTDPSGTLIDVTTES